MGITQNTGASSLIKPGVIDSAAARPASPYEGQCIFQKDTDQLLVWNGTAWVIPNSPAQNPTGLEFITGGTLSTTAIDGIFTSTYDNYRIVANNIQTSGAASLVQYNWRDTSNATVTSSLYYTAGRRFDSAGTNYDFGTAAVAYADTGINTSTGGNWASFAMDIYGPRLTTTSTSTSLCGVGAINGPSIVTTATGLNSVQAHAGIIFKLSAGAFSSGTISVYGYRK